MKLWRNLLIGGFLLTFVLLLGFFNAAKPRIVVLHSGSAGSVWVDQVDQGMRAALAANRRPVSVEWSYLGLASPPGRGVAESTAEARRAIDRFKPDVLIAVDDEANSFVAQHYVGRDKPHILYVSIDRAPAAYGYADAPNVSGDFNHDPHSSIFHMDQTKVMDGTFVRVMSWYDNEWGFSNRMSDTAVAMGKLG